MFKKSQEEVNPPSSHSTLLPQALGHTCTKGKKETLCSEHDLMLHSTGELWLDGLGNRRRPSFLTDFTPVLASSWLCRRNVHRREENPILSSFMFLNLFLSISVLFIFPYKVINFIKIFSCISTELYRFFFSHKK